MSRGRRRYDAGMPAAPAFRSRRIGLCGGSSGLTAGGAAACQALGRALMQHPDALLVTGGTRRRDPLPGLGLAADWHAASAAADMLPPGRRAERIVTMENPDPGRAEVFHLGRIEAPRGRTQQARRISFVRGLDALIAVAGGSGTAQELALAAELGVPVLALPMFGGTARAHWDLYRAEWLAWVGADDTAARRWESPASDDAAVAAALEMLALFLARLPWRCFVVMPYRDRYAGLYDAAIEPAIRAIGDIPLRLDRAGQAGDVVVQIRANLAACDYAVVVLDGLRLNVLYELGFAHGAGKPAILLNRARSQRIARVPFDIASQQRLEYEAVDEPLRQALAAAALALRR